MGKPIDFAGIQRMIDENPDDWFSPEIASLRFQGGLKRAIGQPITEEEAAALALGKMEVGG